MLLQLSHDLEEDDIEQQIEEEVLRLSKVELEAEKDESETEFHHDKAVLQAYQLIKAVFQLRIDDKKIGGKFLRKGKDPLKEYKERVSSIMNNGQI